MKRDREIVVGLDGSVGSVEALIWASGFAAAHGLPLHLVHALHDTGERDDERAVLDRDGAEQLILGGARRAADRGVLEVHRTIAGAGPGSR